jgi:transcriptional regulator
MLIHPWGAAISETEWCDWLAGHDFGQCPQSGSNPNYPETVPFGSSSDLK